MGFYLRKSLSVGPLRFNLSKSGIGVSAGVRGLRIGSGPRGNYVHMGRHGLYYRATIPSDAPSPYAPSPISLPTLTPTPTTHDDLTEIESADVTQIVDSSSSDLLAELNNKRTKVRLLPLSIIFTVLVLIIASALGASVWIFLALAVVAGVAIYFAHQRDILTKTTVLFYDLDPEMEKAYGSLHQWAESLASCSKAWHIEAKGAVRDRKYHAGASTILSRNQTFVKKMPPPYLKTNIETVAIGVGRQVLHFFPDRILIYDSKGVGAVAYRNLSIEIRDSRFIDDGPVPSDANVVDYTWKYVNKKGGPDRRFKDNRQLPICLYEELVFTSGSGLNEIIQISRTGVAEGFAKAIHYLGSVLPPETRTSAT